MKYMKLPVTFMALTLFAVGCKPAEEETPARQIEKAAQKTEAAAQQMQDYSYAQKTEFIEHMEGQLAELKRDLDQFAARVEKSSDAAKAEAQAKLEALRKQEVELNRQLDEVRNATESTWESVKRGSRDAYDSLKEGFQQSRQWMSDKIAP